MKNQLKIFNKNNSLLFLLSIILSTLFAFGSVGMAYILQIIVNASTSGLDDLYSAGITALIYMVVYTVILLLLRKTRHTYVKHAMINYKNMLFANVFNKDLAAYDETDKSAYVSILTNDATTIETDYVNSFFSIINHIVSFIVAMIAMIIYSWSLALVVIVLTILSIVLSAALGGRTVKTTQNVSSKNAEFMKVISEILGGFSVIKSFKAENQVNTLFDKTNTVLEDTRSINRQTLSLVGIVVGQFAGLIQIIVFIIGIYLTIEGNITLGVVIAFVQLMNSVMEPVQSLPPLLAAKAASKGLIEKALKLTNFESITSENLVEIDNIGNGIVFDNVTFAYEEDNTVLDNVNLVFEKSKSYAIVGGSGSGKSTILKLLMGSDSNYSGSIKIDNVEIKDVNKESLFNVLSVLHQDIIVFDATIKDNITMFRTDFSEEKIYQSIKLSGLELLVENKGIDYSCGVLGSNLSGGERQRLSIARSLLKDADVLIMDEATSALDNEMTSRVSNSILDIQGLTKIMVTHNLEEQILSRFDSIIVLKEGQIKEVGKFDELIDKKGYFYSLSNI